VRGLSIADVESGSIEKEMLWVILRFLRIATNGRTDMKRPRKSPRDSERKDA